MKRVALVSVFIIFIQLVPVANALAFQVPVHQLLGRQSGGFISHQSGVEKATGHKDTAGALEWMAQKLTLYNDDLMDGLHDADLRAWSFVDVDGHPIDMGPWNHGYNNRTRLGWAGQPGAAVTANRLEQTAILLWKQGNYHEAFRYIGAVLHLVQDACVCFHDECNDPLKDSHPEFEGFCSEHPELATMPQAFVYSFDAYTEDWLPIMAASVWIIRAWEVSDSDYGLVGPKNDSSKAHFAEVAGRAMPLAVQLGASYLYFTGITLRTLPTKSSPPPAVAYDDSQQLCRLRLPTGPSTFGRCGQPAVLASARKTSYRGS